MRRVDGEDHTMALCKTWVEVSRGWTDTFEVQQNFPCSSCQGGGCHRCGYTGVVYERRTLTFTVGPSSYGYGERWTFVGMGHAGAGGGRNGNFVVIVIPPLETPPDPIQGDNINEFIKVDPSQIYSGMTHEFDTLRTGPCRWCWGLSCNQCQGGTAWFPHRGQVMVDPLPPGAKPDSDGTRTICYPGLGGEGFFLGPPGDLILTMMPTTMF